MIEETFIGTPMNITKKRGMQSAKYTRTQSLKREEKETMLHSKGGTRIFSNS